MRINLVGYQEQEIRVVETPEHHIEIDIIDGSGFLILSRAQAEVVWACLGDLLSAIKKCDNKEVG